MVDSRQKGGNFERKVAKMFTDFFGKTFNRTPQSGAFASKDANFSGDIYCVDGFDWVIECKKYADYNFESLFSSTGIYKWLEQLNREKRGKKGILVFQKNYGKILAAIEGFYDLPNVIYSCGYTFMPLEKALNIVKSELKGSNS